MLEIPSNIFSHTKERWDEIQSLLQSETDDNTPFALTPVRLETRFMKVKRKWSQHIQSKETMAVWDQISQSADRFNVLTSHIYSIPKDEIDAYKEIDEMLSKTKQAVVNDPYRYVQGTKAVLNEAVDFLTLNVNTKSQQLFSTNVFSDSEMQLFQGKLDTILSECDELTTIIDSKPQQGLDAEGDTLVSSWNVPIFEGQNSVQLPNLQSAQYRTSHELWVRIFPDDIHVNSHEHPLTQDEITAGLEYWNIWWNSGGDMEVREGAWKALCELYGPQRAAWIIKQLEPINLPQEPVDDDSVIKFAENILKASTNLVQNNVVAETFDVDEFCVLGASYIELSSNFVQQSAGISLSQESKDLILSQFDEYDIELQAFEEMTDEAVAAQIMINPQQFVTVNFEEGFKPLMNRLYKFRDPDTESTFNAQQWMSSIQQGMQMFTQYDSQIEGGKVNKAALQEASKVAGAVYGAAQSNKQVVGALKKETGNDPKVQLIQQRTGGDAQGMEALMDAVIDHVDTFKIKVKTALKKLKYWEIQNGMQCLEQLYDLKEVFGQIKQNINSAQEPDPWNPFDYITGTPNFPSPETKEGAWTQAPKTFVMPDRFVAVGVNETVETNSTHQDYGKNEYSFVQLEVGELIPGELHLGIDPSISDDNIYSHLPDGSLVVDDNMKWMVDFSEAVNVGMGIIMPLENNFEFGQAENVFDKLMVMGVKVEKDRFHKPDSTKDYSNVSLKDYSKELLEELLVNHHYKEDGMGIIKIGTPTNNTENKESGWSPDLVHYEDAFAFETLNNLFPIRSSHQEQRNGQRIAEALGVDYSLFQHIQHADSNELGDSFKFNKMLWHGTVGNYLKEMLSGLVSRSNYEKVKDYYERYVSARGILPSLRIGNQPYGFLPTTSFTKWSFGVDIDQDFLKNPSSLNENTLHDSAGIASHDYFKMNKYYRSERDKRFDAGFKSMLDLLQNRWYGLFHEPNLVKHVGGVSGTDDFMLALALQASTAEIQLRFPYSIANLFSADNPDFTNEFGNVSPSDFFGMNILDPEWTKLVKNALFPVNSMAFSEDNIANHIQFLQSHFGISKNPIDNHKISESQMINRDSDNYIEWLRTADLRYIWDPTLVGSNDPFASSTPTLMYKLLRQSYLMMHLDAFVDVSVKSGLMDPNSYHYLSNGSEMIGSLISTYGGNIGTSTDRFSKWAYLFENISDFSGSTGAFSHLNDYKAALDQYMTDKNIAFDTTNFTFAQHVQNYYSHFWKLSGGYHNRYKIAELNPIFNEAKTWSTAHLDKLFRENMDLGSYRLDAWMNGFVNRRLERTRRSHQGQNIQYAVGGGRSREKGIYLGAYGWLENVKPGGNRTTVEAADNLPDSLAPSNTTIFKDDDNLGFIHGPSMYHAMTAAILRSGYASNEDVSSSLDNPMAINLSSERVRMAKNLWQGIKNGQSLGALLGYQLERNLHELYNDNPAWELDTYIYQFRAKYPIEEYKTSVSSVEAESIPAQNVVNGINLLGDIREAMIVDATPDSLLVYVSSNLGGSKSFSINVTDPGIIGAIAREIDLLANAIDALGDLAVAEGVFQLSKGNFDRASTTIDTLISNPNMPMPEIIDTPRTGTTVAHRLCVNMEMGTDPMGIVINPWPSVPLTAKANTAPHINKFIGKHLPDPDKVRCIVKYNDFDGTPMEIEISIENLKWQPIDFYTNVHEAINNDRSDVLLNKIATHARKELVYNGTVTIPYDVELSILLNERGALWTPADYTIVELLPIFESISQVTAEINPVKIQDFKMPEMTLIEDDYGWDLSDLDARVSAALTDLNTLIGTTPTDYVQSLTDAEKYSVPYASPSSDDLVELTAQWNRIQDSLTVVSNEVAALLTDPIDGPLLTNSVINDNQKWKRYLEAAQLLFGADFTLLPILDLTTYTMDAALNTYITSHQADLMSNVGTSGFDQNSLNHWFFGLSRLRSKIGAFETLTNFSNSDDLEFSPIQFPYIEDAGLGTHDFWYGWEFPESYELTGNKTSIVMTNNAVFNSSIADQKMVGIMLDQWSEKIPEKKETSGIAFNYNTPSSKPPQNVLLAVTPEFTGNWDGNDILFTLLDTLKMSKVRLVEPEHIQTDPFLGKYLPTTYSLIKLKTNNHGFAEEYMHTTSAVS
ncbi:MAG: hypothetical protein AB8B56_03720 [Crocinitomicaceae bacterium]